jgi:hypothetical protein
MAQPTNRLISVAGITRPARVIAAQAALTPLFVTRSAGAVLARRAVRNRGRHPMA